MPRFALILLVPVTLAFGAFAAAQGPDTNPHLAAARTAKAGSQDAADLFDNLCENQPLRVAGLGARGAARAVPADGAPDAPRGPRPIPTREQYHADPARIFDNLAYVGSKQENAWLVSTSQGHILIDALSSFATEDEVWNGVTALGLRPADIKILLLTHGHADHTGGTKFLQDRIPGLRTYLTARDWDLLLKNPMGQPVPTRGLDVTDGMDVTLGDTAIRVTTVPGHTPGNTALLIPVKEGNARHVAAMWSGTALSQTGAAFYREYSASAFKFREIAVKAGADVLIGGHPHRDGTNRKIPLLKTRKPGEPNPYVIGTEGIRSVMTVIGECAAYKADLADAKSQ